MPRASSPSSSTSNTSKIVPFEQLREADLIVGAQYLGGRAGNIGDEPISKLIPGSGNQGGIRSAGPVDARRFVVLFTTWHDPEWPDAVDWRTGRVTYFGDNKSPGRPLSPGGLGGNGTFEVAFHHLHATHDGRNSIPPFFLFAHTPLESSRRTVQFLGLCAPGFPAMPESDDLVAVWRTVGTERFQNYRATFTILDTPEVPRAWLSELADGRVMTEHTPDAWVEFVVRGTYRPLSK